jgi:antiviral defense system Shedu protein SduA
MEHTRWHTTVGRLLAPSGTEPDQRLKRALVSAVSTRGLNDGALLHALHALNSVVTRFVEFPLLALNDPRRSKVFTDSSPEWQEVPVNSTRSIEVLHRALQIRKDHHTLGTGDVIRATIQLGLEHGESYMGRPFAVDLIAEAYGVPPATRLSRIPQVYELLATLDTNAYSDEDFQYAIGCEGDRFVFRPISILNDYVQRNTSGQLRPVRAILKHSRDNFGGFTSNDIAALEDLLNSGTARESDFQLFFDQHRHFLRIHDYREVFSHVVLHRPEGKLVPDFILTERETQRAALLELKLPAARLVRRQRNRDRFADSVMEARAQLLRYRDWFRDPRNPASLKENVGWNIYEPQLIAVIGRASEFTDGVDRQWLRAMHPDIEIVTYDDILLKAQQRLQLLLQR